MGFDYCDFDSKIVINQHHFLFHFALNIVINKKLSLNEDYYKYTY